MECRAGCGACCIALSISSAIPGMPQGKPAGQRCVQLDDEFRCRLFGDPSRPAVCGAFQAEPMFCGTDRAEAMELMRWLETATAQQLVSKDQLSKEPESTEPLPIKPVVAELH